MTIKKGMECDLQKLSLFGLINMDEFERHWFSPEEEKEIQEHNRQFYKVASVAEKRYTSATAYR